MHSEEAKRLRASPSLLAMTGFQNEKNVLVIRVISRNLIELNVIIPNAVFYLGLSHSNKKND